MRYLTHLAASAKNRPLNFEVAFRVREFGDSPGGWVYKVKVKGGCSKFINPKSRRSLFFEKPNFHRSLTRNFNLSQFNSQSRRILYSFMEEGFERFPIQVRKRVLKMVIIKVQRIEENFETLSESEPASTSRKETRSTCTGLAEAKRRTSDPCLTRRKFPCLMFR